ncbi:MAG TPA: arsinothricin resistance N-acetyltransferase ArsN1 family A [Nitrososphaerales archaeon]|nr:arsinothricin resistance N-acetyltransferase ArsN1 family A [Nitrososphaerales archaeon]
MPKPAVNIRAARLSDAVAIAVIYNQGIEERIATFETKERDAEERREWLMGHDDKHPVLVAEGEEGQAVGWASISAYGQRECYSGIGEVTVYVRRDMRGKGIGSELLAALVDRARIVGYWKLLGRIFVTNASSRRVFEAMGFREVGILEKHSKMDGRWIDVVEVEYLIRENVQ